MILGLLLALASAVATNLVFLLKYRGAVAISAHRSVLHRAEGLLLGLAAGALFGVSDGWKRAGDGRLRRAGDELTAGMAG